MDVVIVGSTAVEIVKVILPVVTFAIGLGYGYYDKIRDRRVRVANTRTILSKEIRDNYALLNVIWPEDDDLASAAPRVPIIAKACGDMKTSVYVRYLDRLDSLRPDELDKIFEAYYCVEEAIETADAWDALPPGPADERTRNVGVTVLLTADNAYKKLREAIAVLPGGEEELHRQDAERGSKLGRLAELEQMFATIDSDPAPTASP